MQNPLEITFHDIDHLSTLEELVREKFNKLESISPNITKCHVVLEKLSKHHQKANRSCVRLDLKVPHLDDIIISEKCDENESALTTTIIKVFKRGQSLMREALKRRQDRNRKPRTAQLDDESEYEEEEVY